MHTLTIATEDLKMPANAVRASFQRGTTKVDISSICLGEIHTLAADLSLAFEHGAGPGLQARAIEAVQDAQNRNFPLHCVLSFGS